MLLFDQICKLSKGELISLFEKTKNEIEKLTNEMNETKRWFDQSKIGIQLSNREQGVKEYVKANGITDLRVLFSEKM